MHHKRIHTAAILIAAFLLSFPWLASRPFYTRGEAREALVPQAMIATGDWILPRIYDGDVPSKPPFSHWLSALCSEVSGSVDEFSVRAPSAFAFVLLSTAWFLFLRRRSEPGVALGSATLLLLAGEWIRAGVSCRVDTLFSALVAGALMLLYRWWEEKLEGVPIAAILLLGCAALNSA
jgi:4-amino-4-deoxy-L-arabinose transferase-like glycosyltransferase